MSRCKLIGLTRHITLVFLLDSEGKLVQHRFKKGVELELDKSQITFHAQRFINKKALKLVDIVELQEKASVSYKIKEKPVEIDTEELFITTGVNTFETTLESPAPKKRRGRKKKINVENNDSIEETDDMNMDEDEGVL